MKKVNVAMLSVFVVLGIGLSGCDTDQDDVDPADQHLGVDSGEFTVLESSDQIEPMPIEMSAEDLELADLEAVGMAETEEACANGDEEACKIVELTIDAVGPQEYGGCRSYYGVCTGLGGVSCASGEGWYACYAGSFLYTWMTICDGWGSHPAGWGYGACLW